LDFADCEPAAAADPGLPLICDCCLLLPPDASDPVGFAAAQLMLRLLLCGLCKGTVQGTGAGERTCSLGRPILCSFM
jgi:hypothetical protein